MNLRIISQFLLQIHNIRYERLIRILVIRKRFRTWGSRGGSEFRFPTSDFRFPTFFSFRFPKFWKNFRFPTILREYF
uniref:Uncharacterized protein n=1 Tax=Meloidogyne enterolobii TaxID=390850 RepID=A0A6V7URU8_MELEN|nr:unnamed protein product [Meloidogyne enterolobii]